MDVLVFCPNWVGDAVMATPTLRALRQKYKRSRIIGIMKPVIRDVLEGLDCFDGWLLYDPRSEKPEEKTSSVVRVLRRQRFDLAVLLTNSLRTAAVAWLGGVRRRVGYKRDGRGLLLTDKLCPVKHQGKYVPYPAIDYYLQLAYYLGCQPQSYQMELKTTPGDEHHVNAIWKEFGFYGQRIVTLNPGAAFGSSKCWPIASFAELARKIVQQSSSNVLVLCGPNERREAAEIVKRSGSSRVHSLADAQVSIGLSKACVRRSDLLITTDSGPRHFAAAYNVPVISLFGPTHREWSETYFAKSIHLQENVPCGPCQLRECPLEHQCMRDLSPDTVFTAALRMMWSYWNEEHGRRSA